jgi:hypothetical protein
VGVNRGLISHGMCIYKDYKKFFANSVTLREFYLWRSIPASNGIAEDVSMEKFGLFIRFHLLRGFIRQCKRNKAQWG